MSTQTVVNDVFRAARLGNAEVAEEVPEVYEVEPRDNQISSNSLLAIMRNVFGLGG